jgi:hypothetical protein
VIAQNAVGFAAAVADELGRNLNRVAGPWVRFDAVPAQQADGSYLHGNGCCLLVGKHFSERSQVDDHESPHGIRRTE